MKEDITDFEREVVAHGVKVGVQCGPGRKYDLQRLSEAATVTSMTWNEECSQFRLNLVVDTIGYVDQADFQLLCYNNSLSYSISMCREAKSGGYSCHYHYMDAMTHGTPTLPIVGQLAGECLAQLFYGPESSDHVVFQQ